MQDILMLSIFFILLFLVSCSSPQIRKMEVTAYCGCGECCSWERGSWKYLKLNFWNRYVSEGKRKGQSYTGKTASGTNPHQYHPGLFSFDSLKRPWVIPFRIIFFPWIMFSHDGTIAADTNYYPFGTRLYIPGYGWGVVEDRGSAIKGPDRLDLYYSSHDDALQWGRKNILIEIYR